MNTRRTVYDLVGEQTFFDLVDRFYEGVATDPILRPMYPEEDLTDASRKLALFFIQYFGGPTTYSSERGHPRLRARHGPFEIGQEARDAWMHHMKAALETTPMPDEVRLEIRAYFDNAATFLINQARPGAMPMRGIS
ncbi:MAG: globin [Dehalococcoidia bacterium]